jgi:hypothetical protein
LGADALEEVAPILRLAIPRLNIVPFEYEGGVGLFISVLIVTLMQVYTVVYSYNWGGTL